MAMDDLTFFDQRCWGKSKYISFQNKIRSPSLFCYSLQQPLALFYWDFREKWNFRLRGLHSGLLFSLGGLLYSLSLVVDLIASLYTTYKMNVNLIYEPFIGKQTVRDTRRNEQCYYGWLYLSTDSSKLMTIRDWAALLNPSPRRVNTPAPLSSHQVPPPLLL